MYPCADGATPLPVICGWRHILRPANFVDVAQEAIETGFSSKLPPAVRHHRLPPKLLPVRPSFQGLQHLQLQNFSPWPRGPPTDLLQLGTRTPQGGPLEGGRKSETVVVRLLALDSGYSLQGEQQCTLYIFGLLGWLEAELCLPMYGKSPEGLYTSILHRLLPSSYSVRMYRLTCFFSV